MIQPLSRIVLVVTSSLVVVAQGPCPGNSGINGYTSIDALNSAMATELSAIKGGSTPKPRYVFTICPNTALSTTSTKPLTPVLSGSEFVCGSSGALSNSCSFQGGSNQVLIQDSTVSGYTLHNVTFRGVTFQGSTQASVIAKAGGGTTVNFDDCKWDGFSGSSAMEQSSSMTVNITKGTVQNGTGNTIFSNDKGVLQINGLTVSDSSNTEGIVTSGGGITRLSNGIFTKNNVQTLVSTDAGSILTVANTDVSQSGANLKNVFFAGGAGTTMHIQTTSIHDITSPTSWDGITYASGATGIVQGSKILSNMGVEFGIKAVDGSMVNVTDSSVGSNKAASDSITAGVIALNSSNVLLERTNLTDNNAFTAVLFAGFQSYAEFENTTFQGGSVTLVVFIDLNSKWLVKNSQFINIKSLACTSADIEKREFIEDPDSKCFYRGGQTCKGKCGTVTNTTGGSSSGGSSSSAPAQGTAGPPASAPQTGPSLVPRRPTKSPSVPGPFGSLSRTPTRRTKVPTGPTKKPTRPLKPAAPGRTTAPFIDMSRQPIAGKGGSKTGKQENAKGGGERPESVLKRGVPVWKPDQETMKKSASFQPAATRQKQKSAKNKQSSGVFDDQSSHANIFAIRSKRKGEVSRFEK